MLEQGILSHLHHTVRCVSSHGVDHPFTRVSAEKLSSVMSSLSFPASFQFVEQAVFVNRVLVPVDLEGYAKVSYLASALRTLAVNELVFDCLPQPDELLELAHAISEGARGVVSALADIRVEGICWREIPGTQWGRMAETVDPDVYAVAQLSLAMMDADLLVEDRQKPWNWALGLAVIRRLERALVVGRVPVARALELAPGQWGVGRRSVSACFRALSVCQMLDLTLSTQRALAHSVLAVCCHGLSDRDGQELSEAAGVCLVNLIASTGTGRSGVEPHRAKVCAAVHLLARIGGRIHVESASILDLLELLYSLERMRCPAGIQLDLTYGDLLAKATSQAGGRFDAAWVRALVTSEGHLPVGACVSLADGRRGVVVEPNPENPLRPRLMVGTRIFVPEEPVSLAFAASHHGTVN